jgi:glutathione S-transferase
MRARLALKVSGISVELREVWLRDKPSAMLRCSPKGTVPVLQLGNGVVIDESLDIMVWALQHRDPGDWLLCGATASRQHEQRRLITRNDQVFKPLLDRYKYADRYPQYSVAHHRVKAEAFIVELELCLRRQSYLVCATPSLADMAILPFMRQFANVDPKWFESAPYPRVKAWLSVLLNTELFSSVMAKYPVWCDGDGQIFFGE